MKSVTLESVDEFITFLREMKESTDDREREARPIFSAQNEHATIKHPQYGWVHCYHITEKDMKGTGFLRGFVKSE